MAAGNVTAFFGDTTGSAHTINLIIDGWQQRVTGTITVAGPMIEIERATNGSIHNVNFRDLGNVASGEAITLSNDVQGFTIADSNLVGGKTGVKLAETTVGATTATPSWTRIHNVLCDGFGTNCVEVETGALFTQITKLNAVNPDAGGDGVTLEAGSRATFIGDSIFQALTSTSLGVSVAANVEEFSVSDSYFAGVSSAVGISIASGSSNDYNIVGNVFDGALTSISDGGSGANKNILANTPAVNNTIDDIVSGPDQPRAKAYKAADQTLTTATATALVFDTEEYDVGAVHDTSTNNTRFTVPANAGGLWLALCSVEFVANTNGTRQLRIQEGGTTNRAQVSSVNVSGVNSLHRLFVSVPIELAAAEYMECEAEQDAGGDLAAVAGLDDTWGALLKVW